MASSTRSIGEEVAESPKKRVKKKVLYAVKGENFNVFSGIPTKIASKVGFLWMVSLGMLLTHTKTAWISTLKTSPWMLLITHRAIADIRTKMQSQRQAEGSPGRLRREMWRVHPE